MDARPVSGDSTTSHHNREGMALGVNHSNWAHPKKLHEQPLTEQSTKCNPRTPMPTGSKQAQRMPRVDSDQP
ncbi:hypothetical protein H4Q26_015508 [Puccinia striiformis f. sp. tritici PST-130]|nr:hypothetical protein H4Q26_015508 [Puccinia striiformis f. sp. tritici PST-130]